MQHESGGAFGISYRGMGSIRCIEIRFKFLPVFCCCEGASSLSSGHELKKCTTCMDRTRLTELEVTAAAQDILGG
jgi:hypothetical protein